MKNRIIVFLLILTMTFGLFPSATVVHADNEIDIEKVEKSINSVISAVDNLKGLIEPEQVSTISAIFSGFTTALGGIGSFVGPINGAVSFLQLIGLMKSSTAIALANISAQLTAINEKISQMDTKLDVITEQMQVMQATEEFNARAIKASQMISAWHSFESNYMEDKMDELLRQYNVLLIDSMKSWLENKTADARKQGECDTDKVIIWYKCTNPPDVETTVDFVPEYELQVTVANGFSSSKSTDVAVIDPYTIYADQFDERIDKYIILDDYFFPAAGEMSWDVNTYRDSLKSYIKDKLIGCIEAKDHTHLKTWNYYDFDDGLTDQALEKAEETANIAVDQIVFRVCSNQVNSSSDFASKTVKQFKEYCNHLVSAQQGLDAMLKTLYLTNAFERDVAEDIEAFMDEMTLKTGVYGMFVMNVTGLSRSVTDSDRASVLDEMCNAIDTIAELKENALTGYDNYCYVTGTVLEYGTVTFSASADILWRHRGMYYAYRSCSGGGISPSFDHDSSNEAALIGDSHAVLLSYVLNASGQTLDHDYMNQNLTKTKREYYGPLVTTINNEVQMTSDANIKLKSQNIIGDYFSGDPVIYPGSLPGSAGFGYLGCRRMVTGTLYDPQNVKLTVNTPLTGIGVYGENHDYWVKDESAVMGGPADMGSFTHSSYDERTDSDLISNIYYTTHYNQSVTYNCLLSFPVNTSLQVGEGEYDPIKDLNSMLETEIEVKDEDHVHEWDGGTVTQEPQGDVPGVITYTCLLDPSHVMTETYPVADTVILTFDPAGGVMMGQSGPVEMEFELGSEIMLPEGPEKEGFAFMYWDSEEFPQDAAFTVSGSRTFTAVYTEGEEPDPEEAGEQETEETETESAEPEETRTESAEPEDTEETEGEEQADDSEAPVLLTGTGNASSDGSSGPPVTGIVVAAVCAAAAGVGAVVWKKRKGGKKE